MDNSTLRSLENLRGKYIKQTLTNIEEIQGRVSNESRKAILDGFNDYHRELLKILEGTENDSQEENTEYRTEYKSAEWSKVRPRRIIPNY